MSPRLAVLLLGGTCALAASALALTGTPAWRPDDGFQTSAARVPILVIALKRRPERLAATLGQFAADPGGVRVVEAVDGRDLDLAALDTTLTTGEVGCFLSHLKALRVVADGAATWALVLEDDGRLRIPLADLTGLIDETPPGVDIISLGANYLPPPAQMRRLTPRLVEFVNYNLCGAHAMLVSRRGARAVLESPRDFRVPYDVWVANTVRVAVAVPSLAVPADITDSETQKTR